MFEHEFVFATSATESVNRKYNTAFLRGNQDVDFEIFLSQDTVVPGKYLVDLYVNSKIFSKANVKFVPTNDGAEPCITAELMEKIGIRKALYTSSIGVLSCVNLEEIDHVSWDYDKSTQKLRLSFPQTAFEYSSRSYVEPALWDEGITTAFVNYNLQGRFNDSDSMGTSRSHHLSLNSGVNFGPWRLRNQSQLSGLNDQGDFKSLRTYVERDLSDWRSQLSVGQIYSRSDVFDSPALLGIQVRSDDSMLPDELRGYSPVVSGVADTNATVEIRQGGHLVYSSIVAPGPFEFRDIPTYGSNGDLEITVIEADGTRKVRNQGFGMLPVMVREGTSRYQLSFGQLDNDLLDRSEQWYLSADGAYGALSDLTFYGGIEGMQHYYALNAGLGLGSRFGSLSFDITHSDSDTGMGHNQGQSYRFRFGRVFHDAGTTLALAGYRYATEDYRSLDDHIRDYSKLGVRHYSSRVRSNVSISVTQQLPGDFGGLNLSASEQDYWDNRPISRSLSASYNHYWERLNYQFGVQKTLSESGDETLLSLYVSHPLSWGESTHNLSLGGSWQQRDDYRSNYQNLGLSGTWGAYNYNLNTSNDSFGNKRWVASTGLRSAFGEGRLGYSSGNGYHSTNAQWGGSLIVHAGGINAAPSFYDGAILVEVPKQEGVGFRGSLAKTGSNGFALVETSTPYRRNNVRVDSRTLADGVELVDGNAQVVPRRGAITYAKIAARKVQRVQFTMLDSKGSALPFGTRLEGSDGALLAIADPHGRALALLNGDERVLVIAGSSGRCQVPYQATESRSGNFSKAVLQCRSSN
ncbi:fimbria/pilus outer membrane usher protein [Aeromonas finlandensis]|uniref:fimbria/pilus outer membrane usher protein n=1 Tax=Aeromonas finlandensis TaxID=1543375 RepID=UPI00138DE848|nr:fimbria/pilus outer membrane usher protein [Aeromonas finlandensis]